MLKKVTLFWLIIFCLLSITGCGTLEKIYADYETGISDASTMAQAQSVGTKAGAIFGFIATAIGAYYLGRKKNND